jgi:hypothetical protein
VPAGKLEEKKDVKINFFFASLKSVKKGVGPGVRSGFVSQRCESVDPVPHQDVTDPQHWKIWIFSIAMKRIIWKSKKDVLVPLDQQAWCEGWALAPDS